MDSLPIYIITGFLESGKTTMIREMLTDEYFTDGERTLLIVCEEGEEEYDAELLKNANTVKIDVESIEDIEGGLLRRLDKEYKPERIIIEYNSTWTLPRLFNAPKPESWELAQLVCMVDSTTFELFLTNMRQIMGDGLQKSDAIIFNRCTEKTEKSRYRRMVKAMNPSCDIVFDNVDGTSDDGVADEDLPYDVKADVVRISDEDFGIWYLDALEHPDRYDGKKLRVTAKAYRIKDLPKNCYVLGREAMTCCANDIGGIGFVCTFKGAEPAEDQWLDFTVRAKKGYSMLHGRDAIVLVEDKVSAGKAPKENLVYFNR